MDAIPSAPVDAATSRALIGVSRGQILEHLRTSAGPLTVAALAEQVDLHPNTVRLHLDQLVTAGLVTRERERRDRPGRPRWVYAIAVPPAATEPQDDVEKGDYRFLA